MRDVHVHDRTRILTDFLLFAASVREFHLKKDATRWPYTNDDMENAFFVLQPPWIHVKPELNKKRKSFGYFVFTRLGLFRNLSVSNLSTL